MRRDAELLAAAERDGRIGLRVYSWDGPWVSLGRSQTAETALRAGCPVPWCARPTGGKAVLHGHDITIGFAMPMEALADSDGRVPRFRDVYRALARPIIAAMTAAGVPVLLAEDRAGGVGKSQSHDCFAAASANDIVCRAMGIKRCGVALRLTRKAVLLQASIPAAAPLVDPKLVYEDPSPVVWSPLDGPAFATLLAREVAATTWRNEFSPAG